METLRDQAAIDYLNRARSCLHPEVDNFGSIPLLAKMISLEETFLTRLVAKGHTGLPIPMGDFGLPELSAWRVDLTKAFDEVAVIRENRAQALDPFLQQLVNASTQGVDKKFEELQRTLASDSQLLRALSGFSEDEVEFLTQEWGSSKSFPFYTDKNLPGLLLSRSDRTPFSERRGKRKRFNNLFFRPGFKYIDADPESQRDPFYMMVALSPERKTLGFRLMTPGAPLLEKSELVKVNATRDYGDNTDETDSGMTVEYYDLGLSHDNSNMEKKLQNLHPAIFRALYQTDYVGKRPAVLESYFESLFRLNTFVDETNGFSEQVLGLRPISAEESAEIKQRLASDLYYIYNAVEDNDLRRALQFAMGEEMSQTRRQTEAAKVGSVSTRNLISALGNRWKMFKK